MTSSTRSCPPFLVGPFCRKGFRDLSRPSTKHNLIGGLCGGVERTFALGFELRSKFLLGKEDLLKALNGRRPAGGCCHFASRPIDRSRASAVDDYFCQGGVVLNLTLAPPAPVTHGMSRVSAVLVGTGFKPFRTESYADDTMAKSRCWNYTTHGGRHAAEELRAENH